MLSRRWISSVVLLLSLSLPAVTSAARTVGQIVDDRADSVARATFIAWSMESLGIDRSDASCELPFSRFPRGQHGTLCAAQERGLFPLFRVSRRYTLGRSITRGEALLILSALTGISKSADVSAFTDLTNDRLSAAVQNAIALGWMTPKSVTVFGVQETMTGRDALALLLAVTSGDTPAAPASVRAPVTPVSAGTVLPKEQLLVTVWQLLQRDYLRSGSIDEEEAGYRAVEAMVDALGDPYTTFFRPQSADDFAQQIKGEIDGIGAQVEIRDDVVTVIAPLPGSPAERAGIRTGDRIVEADGHALVGLSLEKAVQYIRGPRGSTVRLVIDRSGNRVELSVVRETVSIKEIDLEWQGDIAIVKLVQFGETTDRRFRSIMTDVVSRNPRGVVLDLRSNGGGLLHAAGIVVSAFVPRGTVFATVDSKAESRAEVTTEEPVLPAATKVVVLVDSGSASASEIVSGALQDHRRATVVGAKTFGKGTVQQILTFPDGEALKITMAEWRTPRGRSIDGVGLTPDVLIDVDDRDAALRRAVDLLR